MFYLKTDIPRKVENDMIVLESGEAVVIERERVSVPQQFQRSVLFDFAPELGKKTPLPTFTVLLHRPSGKLCVENGACVQALNICPTQAQAAAGAKCEIYKTK